MRWFDCSDAAVRVRGIEIAAQAARRGELVVLPTDTVYGLGCDAFAPESVDRLLAAKGRGREMPVPVLVGAPATLAGLTGVLPEAARALVEAFWPGPLTVVVAQAPSLAWDLGDSGGTVAVRMPLHPVALELLRAVGPMAVSSANVTGQAPATTCAQAADQLGDSVSVYLDGGPTPSPVPSTIVDVSAGRARVLRTGALDLATLRTVVAELEPPP